MREFRVAPSEPSPIKELGPYSELAEANGADIIWSGQPGLCGAQRKVTTDLIGSVRDNRLGKELEQMQANLKYRWLIIEGQSQWTQDGELMSQHQRWTLKSQWGVEMSAQLYGVMVLKTRSALETISCVEYLHDWSQEDHDTSSLLSRGGAQRNGWGKLSDRSYAIHVMSGIDGVGKELAGRLFDHYGRAIIGLTVTEESLCEVKGIAAPTARKIARSLAG